MISSLSGFVCVFMIISSSDLPYNTVGTCLTCAVANQPQFMMTTIKIPLVNTFILKDTFTSNVVVVDQKQQQIHEGFVILSLFNING